MCNLTIRVRKTSVSLRFSHLFLFIFNTCLLVPNKKITLLLLRQIGSFRIYSYIANILAPSSVSVTAVPERVHEAVPTPNAPEQVHKAVPSPHAPEFVPSQVIFLITWSPIATVEFLQFKFLQRFDS